MDFIKITEQESNHKDLEKKSVIELVSAIHQEDKNALNAVNKVLPRVSEVIEAIAPKIKKGGRLLKNSGMKLNQWPFQPSNADLHKNGKNFPPNFLHKSWMDYLYWDVELDP